MTTTEAGGGSQSLKDDPACVDSTAQIGSASAGSCQPSQAKDGDQDDDTESTYHLKWIRWNSGKIPIVMQSINGPCPLIATMNVLLLREKVKLPPMLEQITDTQLLTYLGECFMNSVPTNMERDEHAVLNIEQNIHDAMEILPKLKTGLDVNIRFTGITDFEYTPECIIFDLLRIPLYHGWLCDPDLNELRSAIGNQSYNQLVDNIITNKNSQDPETSARVLITEEFLERTASQLTLYGLNQLKSSIKDNEIGILFRNNHFLTLMKRDDEIYTLVTDHGYLTEDNIIWEILDNIEGAGRFFNSDFQSSEVTSKQPDFRAIDQQLEFDYLVALSLKEEENLAQNKPEERKKTEEQDLALAMRLQAEEEQYFESVNQNRQVVEYDPNNPNQNQDQRQLPSEWEPKLAPPSTRQAPGSLSDFPPLPNTRDGAVAPPSDNTDVVGPPTHDRPNITAEAPDYSYLHGQALLPTRELASQERRAQNHPSISSPTVRPDNSASQSPVQEQHQQRQAPSDRPQASGGRRSRGSQKDSNCSIS